MFLYFLQVILNSDRNINNFFDEVFFKFYKYFYYLKFRVVVFKDVDYFIRILIGGVLDICI